MSYHLYVSQILCPKIFLNQKELSFESKKYTKKGLFGLMDIIGGPISTKCYICSKKGIFGLMDTIRGPINIKFLHLYDGNNIVILLYM